MINNNSSSNKAVYKGIHLYVNINNLDQVIRKEEVKTDNLRRVFHSMDNFVSTSEAYINSFNDKAYVEKLTNSRLHVVFYHDVLLAENFIDSIKFFNDLIIKLNNEPKYNKLLDFKVSMGADYGYFTEFDFNPIRSNSNSIEYTSIGYPANRAAKMQSAASDGELIISNEVYQIIQRHLKTSPNKPLRDKIDTIRSKYANVELFSFTSYSDIDYSKANESKINIANTTFSNNINEKRFSDIVFTGARTKIDFENISLLSPKKVDAVVIYADIRGFTKKFASDGSNLIKMSELTKLILKDMYKSVITKNGVHIQFQGDRESAIRNDFGDIDYVLSGLQIAMHILETVKNLEIAKENNLQIGIGCSHGAVFAAKVGIRKHKHNLIMGETVKQANFAEDLHAGNNEIAIRREMYQYLCELNKGKYRRVMNTIFKRQDDNHYVTRTTLNLFNQLLFESHQDRNAKEAKNDNSQRAWHADRI